MTNHEISPGAVDLAFSRQFVENLLLITPGPYLERCQLNRQVGRSSPFDG